MTNEWRGTLTLGDGLTLAPEEGGVEVRVDEGPRDESGDGLGEIPEELPVISASLFARRVPPWKLACGCSAGSLTTLVHDPTRVP